jgi:putative heme-binding domain-containing protein
VRAVEVLTELFGGLPPATAKESARTGSALVRARVAWSLGRAPCAGFVDILRGLAVDKNARVRCFALAALADHAADVNAETARIVLPPNLADADKRVRQAAVRVLASLQEPVWKKIRQEQLAPRGRISVTLAALAREPKQEPVEENINEALAVLAEATDADLRLQALRVIMLSLGDFQLKEPAGEVYSAYSLQGSLKDRDAVIQRILKTVRSVFPAGVEDLDLESSRLLAMLEDDDPETPRKVAGLWTAKSSPTRDMHYLIVYSRLRGPRDKDAAGQVAKAILGLDGKLERQEQRNKQNWGIRLAEVLVNLLQHDPHLADELVRRPEFVNPGHVLLTVKLDAEHRERAAALFLNAVKKDDQFLWSAPLIDLLAGLPKELVFPHFREQWSSYGLRDALLLQFANHPEAIDREKFLIGLDSPQHEVILACLASLQELPRDSSPGNLVPLLRLLQRLQQEPKEKAQRDKAVELWNRQAGHYFSIKEGGTDQAALKRAYQPIFDWFERTHPKLASRLNGGNGEDDAAWSKLLQSVDWDKGNAKRGATIFRDRACITCHAGPSRLGPDLTSVATRFSRADLFTAIIFPSRDVAPAYRVTILEMKDGKSYSGIVAYESAETVILQTGAATTVRVDTKNVDTRRPSNKSLMPDGLLKDLKQGDLADLYSYLQTLKPEKVGASPPR